MAGGYSAVRKLSIGQSATVGTAPGSYYSVDPQGEVDHTENQQKLEMSLQSTDGDFTAPVLGPKSGSVSFTMPVRGKGADQAATNVPDPPEDIEDVFECAFGETMDYASRQAATAANDTHTTTVVKITDTSTPGYVAPSASGQSPFAVMINTGSDYYECREISAVTTNTSITVSPPFETAPTGACLIHAAASIYLDADNTDPNLLWADIEGENWRRLHEDIGVNLKLSVPPGGLATLQVSGPSTNWEDVAEGITYSAVTSEGGIPVMGCPFYIGTTAATATKTELISFDLDLGMTYQPRTATSGENGHAGWVRVYQGATVNFMVYHTEALLNSLQTASTQWLGLQIGDPTSSATPGSCLYVVVRALAPQGDPKIVSYNGIDAIQVTGKATRPSSTIPKPVSFHLFGKA